jgi:hypothetical protein
MAAMAMRAAAFLQRQRAAARSVAASLDRLSATQQRAPAMRALSTLPYMAQVKMKIPPTFSNVHAMVADFEVWKVALWGKCTILVNVDGAIGFVVGNGGQIPAQPTGRFERGVCEQPLTVGLPQDFHWNRRSMTVTEANAVSLRCDCRLSNIDVVGFGKLLFNGAYDLVLLTAMGRLLT